MSSIVFSSSLTIADAIAAAAKLKSTLKVMEFEQGMSAAAWETLLLTFNEMFS
jgi:adenylate kinase